MPVFKSTPARILELEEAAHDSTRYLDFSLKFRRRKTGDIILRSGGRWDRVTKKFLSTPADRCKVIDLEEAQVEFAEWYADWLLRKKADATRDRIVLTGGPRRAGKTFVCTFATIAHAIDVPESINWMISPTFMKRDELERLIKGFLPRAWWRYRDAPIYRFTLVNGSVIQLLSGEDPEALKRGGASTVFFNEMQEFSSDALTYALPAIIDDGGLCLMAANPPRRYRGEWILGLREAILEKRVPGGKSISFKAGLNEQIDQSARADVGEILKVVDPRAAIADDEGAWLPVGDRAYPRFDKNKNLGHLPELGDITGEWTRKRIGRAYANVGGMDFQARPWHCGVVIRVFKGEQPLEPIYHVIDEQLTDGVEEDWLHELDDKDRYDPGSLMFVGDASGAFQSGDHTKGRQSFTIFKKFGWRIVPPREKLSDKGVFSKNPDIEDRLNLVNMLLARGRLVVDPDLCPRLAEALKDCELKLDMNRRRPYGRHAHITDALGYCVFWLEPRAKVVRKPSSQGMAAMSIPVTGPRLF